MAIAKLLVPVCIKTESGAVELYIVVAPGHSCLVLFLVLGIFMRVMPAGREIQGEPWFDNTSYVSSSGADLSSRTDSSISR